MTDENEEKTAPEFSLSGNAVAYSVEIRTTFGSPVRFGDLLVGTEWQTAKFNEAPPWAPSVHSETFPKTIMDANLLSWNAANAHMWLLQCEADRHKLHFVETRIIAHDVNYSVRTKPTGVVVNEGGTIGSTAKTGAAELDQYERNKAADEKLAK